MYQFAVMVLLALAIVKVVDFVTDLVPFIERFRSLLALVLAVGSVAWLDFSLFEGWDIGVRSYALGIVVTGLVVWGLTVPWRAAFAYLTHDRAAGDESLGVHTAKFERAA